jgi:hypothetical protein
MGAFIVPSGTSAEDKMQADIGGLLLAVFIVAGGVLSMLALGVYRRSRVAHVIAVGLYGIFALVSLPWLDGDEFAWPILIAIAPAILGLVLLLLPSSRAWCYAQRT